MMTIMMIKALTVTERKTNELTLLLCGDKQATGLYPAAAVTLLALPLATDDVDILAGCDVITVVVDGFVTTSGRYIAAPPLSDGDVRALRASVLTLVASFWRPRASVLLLRLLSSWRRRLSRRRQTTHDVTTMASSHVTSRL